ncbi:DUF3472 domain-containing protein [Rapidithrix thailandica]|uniref:DUF3472 domain-containing protein n=1 Tax=Rapidithrix thailandica TaxID=413964 RepID=A0AAW9S711_9BACT
MKKNFFYTLLATCLVLTACKNDLPKHQFTASELTVAVPTRGNSWVHDPIEENQNMITENGIQQWKNPASQIRSFFRVETSGEMHLGIRAKVVSGRSTLNVTLGDNSKEITLSNTEYDTIPIGTFNIAQAGYQTLTMQGISKTADTFADVSHILIGGPVSTEKMYFVKEDFYWGRRGPSVHLSYQVPEEVKDVEWFYNEITVPEGEDVIGSYFMANGFGEGYFGIQVNSATERRILFSVWSPYKTDNPEDIPEDQRIQLLKKGEDVHAGKFGNEGSGGQSYRKYMWKAGNTYRFLLRGRPSSESTTEYSAYFYAPEIGEWQLIASFSRPKTHTYLTRPHSFLENFITSRGQTSRKGHYGNQWVCDKEGNWHELTKAKFTADATARKDSRLDYAGGEEGGRFFLKNCGFFSERTEMNSYFTREATGQQPEIDFSTLP